LPILGAILTAAGIVFLIAALIATSAFRRGPQAPVEILLVVSLFALGVLI
jgi:hypothetical protein